MVWLGVGVALGQAEMLTWWCGVMFRGMEIMNCWLGSGLRGVGRGIRYVQFYLRLLDGEKGGRLWC